MSVSFTGVVILPGATRPDAAELYMSGENQYTQLVADELGRVTSVIAHQLQNVGHEPCGWTHPSWEDEHDARLDRHLKSCELRTTGDNHD